MSKSYGQLGILAQLRCDYAEAERRYRRSLEIVEELGDRAGMARTLSQLGVLLTERGNIEDAVGYNVRGLALRLDIGSPDARINVHWLRRQQELLREVRFDELLRTQLDETSVANLKDYLS